MRIFLLLLGMWVLASGVYAQCGCDDCGGVILDNSDERFLFIVDDIANNDLSSPTQGLCKVSLKFRHSYLGDLRMFLSSPTGQVIQLIGPAPVKPGGTALTAWDVSFVPGDGVAIPDPGKPAIWDNNLDWLFVFGTYTGSYYPHSGDLRDFDTGPVIGIWTLTVQDRGNVDSGVLDSFALEFCDPTGIDCSSCGATAGTLLQDTFWRCHEDNDLVFSVHPSFGQSSPLSEAQYAIVLSKNDTIQHYLPVADVDSLPISVDLDTLGTGHFEICGLSYVDSLDLPVPGLDLLSSLRDTLHALQVPYCAEMTDSCIHVFVFPERDTTFLTYSICPGDTVRPDSTHLLTEVGTYVFSLVDAFGCDSTTVITIEAIDSSIHIIEQAICTGDTFSFMDTTYAQSTEDTIVLSNAAASGCDSIIYLSIRVLAPVAHILEPDTLDCLTDTVSLHAINSSPSGGFFEWFTVTGSFTGDLDTSITSTDSVGNYGLRYSVSQWGTTCHDTAFTEVVADRMAPLVTVPSDTFIDCKTSYIRLFGRSTPDASVLSYWIAPDGSVHEGTDTSVHHSGTYQFRVIDMRNGCETTDSVVVAVDTLMPVVQLQSDTLTCNDTLAQITAKSNKTLSFVAWTGPNGLVGNMLSELVNAAGKYAFVYEAENGCRDTQFIQVVIDTAVTPFRYQSDTLTCVDTSICLTASSFDSELIFQWMAPDGQVQIGDSLKSTLSGNYTLTAIATNGCRKSTAVQVLSDTLAPRIVANDDTINCIDTVVTLMAKANVPIVAWNWVDQDVDQSSLLVKDAGAYLLEATAANGCTSAVEATVIADTASPQLRMPITDTLNCADTSLLLSADGTHLLHATFRWLLDDIPFSEKNQVSISQSGTYELRAIDTINACSDAVILEIVMDTMLPDIEIKAPDGIMLTCERDTLLLMGHIDKPAHIESKWYLHNGHVSSQERISVVEPGEYVYEIKSLTNACIRTDSVLVTIDTSAPIANISSEGNLTCRDTTVKLTGASVVDARFQWLLADTSLSENRIATVVAPGLYVLRVTDTISGCASTDSILLEEDKELPILELSKPDTLTCDNESVQLRVENLQQGVRYEWTFKGSITDTGRTLLTDQAGLHVVTAINEINGCTHADTIFVSIDTIPPVVNAGEDMLLACHRALDTLSGSVSGGDTYVWRAISGSIRSGKDRLNPVVTVGTYLLTATRSENGCSSSDTVNIQDAGNFTPAYAGRDTLLCNREQYFIAEAQLPSGASGTWTYSSALNTPDATLPNATFDISEASGKLALIWTLSTTDCPNYSADTLYLELAQRPMAQNDEYVLDADQGQQLLPIQENDGAGRLSLLSPPQYGSGTMLKEAFQYIPSPLHCGEDVFTYRICHELCLDLCDTAVVQVSVTASGKLDEQTFPNAITPNGDGINDVLFFDFLVDSPCFDFDHADLLIFNRWGNLIYRDAHYANDWDGTRANGELLPQGTYYYVLKLDVTKGLVFQGDISILR